MPIALLEAKKEVNNLELVRQLYKEYNAKYFNGECPPGLPIVEVRSKGILASVRARVKFVHFRGESKVPPENITQQDMTFSPAYRYTDEQLKALLLHEMIHSWLFTKGIVYTLGDKMHGREFIEKLKEVESASGITIPRTEMADEFDFAMTDQVAYGVYMRYSGSKEAIFRIAKGLIDKPDLESFVKRSAESNNGNEAWVFQTTGSAKMYDLPASRSIKGIKWRAASAQVMDELLSSDLTKLKTFKL